MSGAFPSFTSRTIELRGLTIHYLLGGAGSPVILVHGLGSSASFEWRFNLEALAAHHQVVALDLPGFGRSDKPPADYSIPFFTDILLAFVAARGGRPALIGASYGGRIVLGAALEMPQAIDRLVLVDALGVGTPRGLLTYRLLLVRGLGELVLSSTARAMRRLRPALVRRLWGWYLSRPASMEKILSDTRIADHRQMLASADYRAAYLKTLRGVASLQRLRDGVLVDHRLGELTQPILLVWGRHDHVFPASAALAAQRRLRRGRIAVFEDSGHTPQLEEPERFNQLVLEFLR